MSNYEANPAGLGIGQRYGAREVGGTSGTFGFEGSQREAVYELEAGEPLTGVPMTVDLPANYVVETIYFEVEEAFAATSTANLSINGGAGLTAAIALSTAGPLTSKAITGLGNLSGTAAVKMVLTGNAAAIASSTGRARVVVRFKAV